MKFSDGWWWPDHEEHMLEWVADPKNRVILNGRPAYQGRKQMALQTHCKRWRTAIDVGAHVGLWSFNLTHNFALIHAFEPVRDHRDCYIRNMPGRIPEHDWILHGCALGATPGHVSIVTTQGSSGDSQIRPDGYIEMCRLDEFKIQNVDLIKIDCEGYEENVLVGALDTIMEWKPVIIVEQKRDMAKRFGLKPQGAVSWLQYLGYKSVEEISGDYIMVHHEKLK